MKSHHLIVGAGAILGVIVGALIWQTQPAFLGWVFGLGLGLLGGAFTAAISSGTALGGGAKRTRREREWLLRGDDEDER